MIGDVRVTPLKQIAEQRGKILHMLRSDSEHFRGFGEVYFSKINSGAVKAWKRHSKTTQQLTVPVGSVRIVVYDARPDSPFCGDVQVIDVGEDQYRLVEIPTMLWYGFKGVSQGSSLIVNCIDSPYDDSEIERIDSADPAIPYRWEYVRP